MDVYLILVDRVFKVSKKKRRKREAFKRSCYLCIESCVLFV